MNALKNAEHIVLSFIQEMNEWEKYCNQIDGNSGLSLQEEDKLMKDKVFAIFSKYCTLKDRKMGRPNTLSWGTEGSYEYDSEKEKITQIVEETSKKNTVYTHRESSLEEDFCYIILKKKENWLIDSKKRRFSIESSWENIYL